MPAWTGLDSGQCDQRTVEGAYGPPPPQQRGMSTLYPPLLATPKVFALKRAGPQSQLEVYMGQSHHRWSGYSFSRSPIATTMAPLNNHGVGAAG